MVFGSSAFVALELFKTRPDDFDLVVTDMNMPHMNGLQLASRMMSIRPDILIILCAGFSHQASEQKVKAMGIKALVMKPVNWHDLAATVRKILDENDRGMKIVEMQSVAQAARQKNGSTGYKRESKKPARY